MDNIHSFLEKIDNPATGDVIRCAVADFMAHQLGYSKTMQNNDLPLAHLIIPIDLPTAESSR
jgi:hypothetical protein